MERDLRDDWVDAALVVVILSLADAEGVCIERGEVVGKQDEASKGPSTFNYNNVEAAEADKPPAKSQSIGVALAHDPDDNSNSGTNQCAASTSEGGCV